MNRNLRVKRRLEEWRQEGNSYLSTIPRDILNVTLEYMEADTWKEEFRWTPIWLEKVSTRSKKFSDYLFLADGSVIIANQEHVQMINLDGRVTECKFKYNPMMILRSDPRQGFWWTEIPDEGEIICLHHYDPLVQQEITSIKIHLPNKWLIHDWIIDQEGNGYLSHQSMHSVEIKLVKYLSNGSISFPYPAINYWGRLLFHRVMLYSVRYGKVIVQDFKQNTTYFIWPGKAFDFCGKRETGIYQLTDRQVYLLVPDQTPILLYDLPKDLLPIKIIQPPNGQLLILCQFINQLDEYMVYCLD